MSESTQERGISNRISKREDGILSTRNKRAGRITGLTLGVATAAASAAQAAPVAFGPDVNLNSQVRGGQLNPEALPGHAKLTFFGGVDEASNDGLPLYEKEISLVDDVNGGVVVRGLGEARPIPPWDPSNSLGLSYLEMDRGDGNISRAVQSPAVPGIRSPEITIDGVLHWEAENGCDHIDSIHRDPFNPRGILVTAAFDEVPSPGRANVWRVNVDQPGDWCQLVKDQIATARAAGQNMFQSGLLDRMESTGHDEVWFAADENLAVSSRDNALSGNRELVVLERRDVVGPPPMSYHWRHLRVSGNSLIPEAADSANGAVDNLDAVVVTSIAKLQTPSGRDVHMMITSRGDVGDIDFRIFERLAYGNYREVSTRLEEVDNPQALDTDGDGVPDKHPDGTQWDNAPLRANPGQVDTNNDGIGDAMQADCTGNFPGVNPVGPTNPSGLRVCANSELGYDLVVSDSDGSTYHSNGGEVVLAHDGDILAQPGQELRIIHSKDPRTPIVEPRPVRLADGNSVQVEFFETSRRDGTPGTALLTGFDLNDNPVRVVFNGPTARRNLGVVRGGVISTEGTDFVLLLGNENPNPNEDVDAAVPPPVDAAVVDAAIVDASAVDAAPPADAAVDAALQDAAIADAAADAAVVVVIVDAAVSPVDAATPNMDAAIIDDAARQADAVADSAVHTAVDAAFPELDSDVPPPVDAALEPVVDAAVVAVDASLPEPCVPTPEICDGLDNDCDNEVDNDENGEPMTNEVANECEMMVQVCVDGELLPPADVMRQPLAEQCNGADDDCDGVTDEGMDTQCENECGNAGMIRCVNAQMTVCDAPVCSAPDGALSPADVGVSPLDATTVVIADAAPLDGAVADVANVEIDGSSAQADVPTMPGTTPPTTPSQPATEPDGPDEQPTDETPVPKKKGGGGGCDIKGTGTDAKVPLAAAALVLTLAAVRRRKRQD